MLLLITLLFISVTSILGQTKIHKGNTISHFNTVLTIDGNKIRQGDGTSSLSNPVLYTIDENKIRQGDGTFNISNKVLYRMDENKI